MHQNSHHRLSKEAVRDFKEIYSEEFGEDLTDDEAEAIARRIIRFFHVLVYGKSQNAGR